jgi:DNA-binding beta-propeller fold protein YncE
MWSNRGARVPVLVAAIACGCAAASGPLVFADAVRDGAAGVTGIDEPAAIAISPDGAQLYVAGSGANAVAIFARDADTGALRLRRLVRDTRRGVDGLDQPGDIAISPDGANVYVAGFDDDALAVFARDAKDGKLRFLSVMRDRVGGVRGLGGAVSVVVSPDGSAVYVAGRQDDSIAVFARDAKSGSCASSSASARAASARPRSRSRPTAATCTVGLRRSAVAVFERDTASHRIRRTAIVRDADDPTHALTNAASVAVSPDGGASWSRATERTRSSCSSAIRDTGELHGSPTARAGRRRDPRGCASRSASRSHRTATSSTRGGRSAARWSHST